MQRAVGSRDRVGIDDTKNERAAGRLCPDPNCPTQAKTGLEWATRRNLAKLPKAQ